MIRDYIDSALKYARYDKLDDSSFSGEIPKCPGTIAFGETLEECRRELEAALQDWLLSALRHGDELPVIDGIDLNASAEVSYGVEAKLERTISVEEWHSL